jgi:hypothetical protein
MTEAPDFFADPPGQADSWRRTGTRPIRRQRLLLAQAPTGRDRTCRRAVRWSGVSGVGVDGRNRVADDGIHGVRQPSGGLPAPRGLSRRPPTSRYGRQPPGYRTLSGPAGDGRRQPNRAACSDRSSPAHAAASVRRRPFVVVTGLPPPVRAVHPSWCQPGRHAWHAACPGHLGRPKPRTYHVLPFG